VVDAEARESGDDVTFEQILKTDNALSFVIIRQNVLYFQVKRMKNRDTHFKKSMKDNFIPL